MHPIDNIVWNALDGPHRRFSIGTDQARRYDRGFAPIAAFRDPLQPSFDALAPYCERDEHFYIDGWSGPTPGGWRVEFDSTMFKMIWNGTALDADGLPEAVSLTSEHLSKVVDLVSIAKPGPFGPRSLELGNYFGVLDGDRLVAMAGERFAAGRYREVSAVCTHPDYQGRGLARKLMLKIIRRQQQRGEMSFLHVMRSNAVALGLYERMGFSIHSESVVRVVSRD